MITAYRQFIFALCTVIVFVTCATATENKAAAVPLPDIRANGSDGPLNIGLGDLLEVNISLAPGDQIGQPADWWVAAQAPTGIYWHTAAGDWTPSASPIRAYAGPLINLSPLSILSMSDLPVGEYIFYFAVDDNQDDKLDADHLDQVEVTITDESFSILNDTGIIACADGETIDLPCPLPDYPGQDAEYGRDVTHYDDSDGHAGFSFTKLDENGNSLPASAAEWPCVKDNVTGLIWEVKTDDNGLQDKDNTYTWYNPDANNNGGDAGAPDGGICTVGDCDTQGYAQAVNAQGLCGANDWRMPTIKELENIASQDRYNPAIDTDYFPNTGSSIYWSASPGALFSGDAWRVFFNYSYSNFGFKSSDLYVRLVRGGQ